MLLHNHSFSFKLIFTFSILTSLGRRFLRLYLLWVFFFLLLLLDGLDLFFLVFAEADLILEVVSEVEHQVDEV